MLEDYINILYETCRLAEIKRRDCLAEQRNYPHHYGLIDLADIGEYREDSELLQFLLKQDMETIKAIQTVMYLGREYVGEYASVDDREDDGSCVIQKREKLFADWMKDSDGVSGWKNKDAEIDRICEKLPLDTYLKRAFRIFGI